MLVPLQQALPKRHWSRDRRARQRQAKNCNEKPTSGRLRSTRGAIVVNDECSSRADA
jgi:hypothetical protein